MKSSVLLVAALAATLALPAIGQDATTSSLPSVAADIAPANVTDPQTFTDMAAVSNLFEIQSSQLALNQASDENVRAFAQQMIDDHGKAGEELRAAAASQGSIAVPEALDQAHADKLAQLQAATGADFDRLYVDAQTQAHIDAVGLFAGYAQGGQDGALKDFAAKTLPTLQQHYEHVLALPRAE